jgi:hypothetical protein
MSNGQKVTARCQTKLTETDPKGCFWPGVMYLLTKIQRVKNVKITVCKLNWKQIFAPPLSRASPAFRL